MSDPDDVERDRRAAASAWVAKLSRTSVSNADLAAFYRWADVYV